MRVELLSLGLSEEMDVWLGIMECPVMKQPSYSSDYHPNSSSLLSPSYNGMA